MKWKSHVERKSAKKAYTDEYLNKTHGILQEDVQNEFGLYPKQISTKFNKGR
jgi:hypothetical protein